jgi:hypothetical protein
MTEPRWKPSATLLRTGKVLVVGGSPSAQGTVTAELYDPDAGSWSPTGTLSSAHDYHTSTLLPSGKVLVIGNGGPGEIYDPGTGAWSVTSVPPRDAHTATLLDSGQVLIAGGVGPGPSAGTAVYDPQTDTLTPTGSLSRLRIYATAARLPSGRVLLAGGQIVVTSGGLSGWRWVGLTEIYDTESGVWTETATTRLREPFTLTRLLTGRVLAAGGLGRECDVYDEGTGLRLPTGSLIERRERATATLLASGKVLMAGGAGDDGSVNGVILATAELYDPATGLWEPTAPMADARYFHAAARLPAGRVLTMGGIADAPLPEGMISSAELFDEGVGPCALDVTGRVLVIGLAIVPISFTLRRFRWVILVNSGDRPLAGPLTYVMDDLQGAAFVGTPYRTTCFTPAGDPLSLVAVTGDGVLSPGEGALTGLWFVQTQLTPISYVPRVLSGVPLH